MLPDQRGERITVLPQPLGDVVDVPTIRAQRFVIDHSLTIGLVITGLIWAVVYARLDVDSKAGEVVGNIVSEWTQIFGLVLLTKKLIEKKSKESEK